MDRSEITFTRGDPIEIKFATHDGDIWNPATVVVVDATGIGVAFSSGDRMKIPHKQNRYRKPA